MTPATWDQMFMLVCKMRRATLSFALSVHPSACMKLLISHRTDFREILYLGPLKNLSRKSKFGSIRAKISGTLHKYLSMFYIVDNDIM
jgi:hypothetical protein